MYDYPVLTSPVPQSEMRPARLPNAFCGGRRALSSAFRREKDLGCGPRFLKLDVHLCGGRITRERSLHIRTHIFIHLCETELGLVRKFPLGIGRDDGGIFVTLADLLGKG